MKQVYFVTGTDTNVGKTFVAGHLLKNYKQAGYKTAALKPVACGCEKTADGLRDNDAVLLQQAITEKFAYDDINPIAFEQPIAPHLAAAQVNIELNIDKIITACQPVLQSSAERIIIEGAGGWHVPLNQDETMADLALALGFPVILVVGIRLGCLNHAMLTVESIKQKGVSLAGWVANCIDPDMKCVDENISSLQERIDAPLIERVDYKNSASNR